MLPACYLSQTGPKQWKGQGREAREVGRGGVVGGVGALQRGGLGGAKTPGSVASADTCYLWTGLITIWLCASDGPEDKKD